MATGKGQVYSFVHCVFISDFFCRYLGVTPPISTTESNVREQEVTATLMEELRRQKTFETEEGARRR